MQETRIRSLGQEDPLGKKMATYSNILAWKNPLDRGVWQAIVHWATKESDYATKPQTTKPISN